MVRALRALGSRAAGGSSRGGRERPPYNPPQMGAGKRNVGRKGKVSGFACRLPCFAGRAISPAGQHSDGRKVCGTVRAWNRKAAAGGSSRGGRERPPYNLPGTGAKTGDGCQENRSCRRDVFFISTAACFAGRAISPAGQHSDGRKVCGTVRALLPREGKGVARCRTPPPPAAHSPSGLRCPHRTARAEARLCSATAAPAPSRFLRRRRRSTPQPLAEEALQAAAPQRLPCKGSWHHASDDGGVHCHPVLQISCRVVTAGRPAGRCRHCRPLKIPQPRPKAAPQFLISNS